MRRLETKIVPNVFSPRDLVSRPDNMDETVPHTSDQDFYWSYVRESLTYGENFKQVVWSRTCSTQNCVS